MFQELRNRKSGRSAEQNMNKTDNPNYEAPEFSQDRPFDKVKPVYKPNNISRSKCAQVYRMTKQGGDPIKVIMAVSGADDQMKLLSYQKHKALGIDRPTVRHYGKITPELEADIISRYASNQKVSMICEDLKVSDTSVYRIASEVITRKPPVRTPEMKTEVLKMYDGGLTCNQIARHFQVRHQVIRHIILTAHPEMTALSNRKFVRLTPDEKKRILQMFQDGQIIGNIAELTGHSKTTVERIVGHVPARSYTKHNDVIGDIYTCWQLGYSWNETRLKLNLPKTSVRYHFDKFKKGLFPSI